MDLTIVGIDTLTGKITNTSSSMQYSLDSTNGTDGNWIDANESDTSESLMNFVGKIFVREKNKPENFKLVAESPDAPTFIAYSNPTSKLVGLPANTILEARLSDDGGETWLVPWTTISTNSNGEASWGSWVGITTQVRVKATATSLTGYTAQQDTIVAP